MQNEVLVIETVTPGEAGGILVVSDDCLFHGRTKTLAGTSRCSFSKASQFRCACVCVCVCVCVHKMH